MKNKEKLGIIMRPLLIAEIAGGLLLLGLVIFFVVRTIIKINDYVETKGLSVDFESAVILDEGEEEPFLQDNAEDTEAESEEMETKREDLVFQTVKYDYGALLSQSPNASAFINIPGTPISYPVMWSEDTEYYLSHASNGSNNSNGAIFLAGSCSPDFTDRVNYLFGHNIRGNLMFRDLNNFLDPQYLSDHSDINIVTDDGTMHYNIFYAEAIDPEEFSSMASSGDYASYVSSVSERTGAVLPTDSRLLFLITCYTKDRSKRVVVYACEG